MEGQIVDNLDARRFEYHFEGGVAFVEYIRTSQKFFLTHTEVPDGFQGKGIASAMVSEVLAIVEKSGLPLMPLCPYVAAYLKRHPEWKRILDESVSLG